MSPNEQPLSEQMSNFYGLYRTKVRRISGMVDIIPLIDLVLIVFVFFMMNSPFVLQPGIKIDLPQTPFKTGTPYGKMVVALSQEDMVFFNDERITLRGLNSAFSQAFHQDPEATLLIEADARVPHGAIMEIYNMAIKAGIKEIAIATRIP